VLFGDQPNLHHAGTQIEIRMVACRVGDPSDLIDQFQAGGEVAGSEDRERNRPQDSPVVDAGSIVELLGSDQLVMAATVVSRADGPLSAASAGTDRAGCLRRGHAGRVRNPIIPRRRGMGNPHRVT
jgi:hypothetical protein